MGVVVWVGGDGFWVMVVCDLWIVVIFRNCFISFL